MKIDSEKNHERPQKLIRHSCISGFGMKRNSKFENQFFKSKIIKKKRQRRIAKLLYDKK